MPVAIIYILFHHVHVCHLYHGETGCKLSPLACFIKQANVVPSKGFNIDGECGLPSPAFRKFLLIVYSSITDMGQAILNLTKVSNTLLLTKLLEDFTYCAFACSYHEQLYIRHIPGPRGIGYDQCG